MGTKQVLHNSQSDHQSRMHVDVPACRWEGTGWIAEDLDKSKLLILIFSISAKTSPLRMSAKIARDRDITNPHRVVTWEYV